MVQLLLIKKNMATATTTAGVTAAKNISYVAIFVASLGLDLQMLTMFVVLMCIDVITGVSRAFYAQSGMSVRSAALRKGIVSKMMLLLIIFSIGVTAQIIGIEAIQYVQAAITVLALGELYSIVGNVHSMRTGKPKAEFDAVTFVLRKIKDILDKYV